MTKECFSCQRNAPKNLYERLVLHKKIYDTTGKVFWFFKESSTYKVKIADAQSFSKILEKIRDNEGAEWCHIAEFGNATNDNVFKDTTNKKPKTIKRKGKRRTT